MNIHVSQVLRIVGPIIIIGLALLSDQLENTEAASIGMMLWTVILIASILYLLLQAKRVGESRLLALVGLVPFFGLLAVIVFAALPTKKQV